ncbi:hypothetical protein MMC20_004042 [Loxospora ochrophaea]|nr:hypothetical protein [Loxospora ochrophaea]
MFRSNRSDETKHGEEESLTTVLNSHQRGELTLLVAGATASMRSTIESNFDATASLSPSMNEASEEDKIMNPNVNPGTADVEQLDRERKLKEQREEELSAPQMMELKAASLKFFDEWRENVMQRIGEVVNSKETASEHLMEASSNPPPAQHELVDKKINPEAPVSRDDDEKATASAFHDLYPPIPTSLSSLENEKRILIVHSMLLLLLSLEHYVAPSRVLLLYLTSSLGLELSVLTSDEEKVAKGLLEAAKQLSGDSEAQKKVDENKSLRKWKVGLAGVAGAALIGVTGGLAAPLVAAGVGSVMGGLGLGATAAAGYLGSVAGSTMIVGGLFGAYGGRMTGQMMDNYARQVEDFAFIPVSGQKEKHEADERREGKEKEEEAVKESGQRRLRVMIGISGWLTEENEVVEPWRVVGKGAEVFALRWELEALMKLGNSMNALVSSAAWGYAKSEIIKQTIFAELASAFMWPMGLVKVARVVDNPFSVTKSRADKAGEVLADALINKAQGERPVTLIGYSLGARVIYSCLMSLSKRKAFGLVESVVLIGAPTPSTTRDWRTLRSVVAGRLVNVFSENDYVLGFLYRTSSIQYGIAGLQKIEGLPSVENVDVSETVSGHLRYRYLVGSILKKIGFEDVELAEVEKEEAALKEMDEEEEKTTLQKRIKEQAQKQQQELQQKLPSQPSRTKTKTKNDKGEDVEEGDGDEAEKEAEQMEKEVEAKTQGSMMQRAAEQLHIRSAT